MKNIVEPYRHRTMIEWRSLAIDDNEHWRTLYGNADAELCPWHKKDQVIGYTLELIGMNLPDVPESAYIMSQGYFYYRVHVDPDIYIYVSRSVGGAIQFRGHGRWSGDAFSLGKELGKDFCDVFIDGTAGCAMNVLDVYHIIVTQFPGLEFEFIKTSYHFDLIVNYKEDV